MKRHAGWRGDSVVAGDVDWQQLLEDLLEVERECRNSGMPMVEDYSDEQFWEEDFECWLNGELVAHRTLLCGQARQGVQRGTLAKSRQGHEADGLMPGKRDGMED